VHTTPTKTRNSRRIVDLDPSTVTMLNDSRARSDRHDGVVFTGTTGEALHPQTLSQTFGRLQARAELLRIRFHDLRHTHATLLLKAGVPLKVVSERLGHSTPAFTMAVYQHVLPGMQRDAADTSLASSATRLR
jgi:integrase